ncbi:CHC2 zinc finger domain-containing protein [Vineibacter terrae]|uniref:CHC2 zinc finger domain-containing protein n=1 Tax=Vineibacter terrae TaxID=2586908 RepID=UPI002E35E1E3|nr:CHC2 zinc finger domain-containing protein [Vineibacter terrae]HEX2892273.1 CHC2 zinc finger domain-containing protein [Vineibacter terrae]
MERVSYRERADAVLRHLLPSDVIGRRVTLKKRAKDFVGLCPFHNEKTPSFWVVNRKRFFHCFGCGASGDVIDFVMRDAGRTFVEALELLESESGLQRYAAMPAGKRRELDDAARQRRAQDEADLRAEAERKARTMLGIWAAVRPVVPGGPVDIYLRGRSILPPASYGIGDARVNAGWPVDFGYHASLWHPYAHTRHPAMVTAIRSPAGELWAVHQTYLVQGDRGLWAKAAFREKGWAKLVLGTYARESVTSDGKIGGYIRLGPEAPSMIGGEGIETSLSAMQIWRRSGLSFVGASNMRNVDLPFGCRDFIYAADRDPQRQGERWSWRAAERNKLARRVGVHVPRLPDQKCDFNDVLQRSVAMQEDVV